MSWVEWLQATPYATWIRESDWAYPALQAAHIVGIALLFGSSVVMAARVLGLGRQELAAPALVRHLRPIAWLGFGLIVLTGVQMAWSFLEVFAVNPVLGVKLALIAVGAVATASLARAQESRSTTGSAVTGGQRALALLIVAIWISVIVCGKLLAYIGGKD